MNVILKNGKLSTDLYSKSTDSHLFLQWNSCHPNHIKKNLPYSLALRIRRICSENSFFEQRVEQLQKWLRERGYKNKYVKEGIAKARKRSREEALEKDYDQELLKEQSKEEKVILTVTYNPALPNIKKILDNLKPVLDTSERLKTIYKGGFLIGYRRARNLNDMLVSRRLSCGNQINIEEQKETKDTKALSNYCSICNRSFKDKRSKRIHMTHKHQPRSFSQPGVRGFHECKDKRCLTCKVGNFSDQFESWKTGE